MTKSFAPIGLPVRSQGIKRKQDLADLAPKGFFISAEAVERVVGQVGETQRATRELSGGIGGKFDRFRRGASERFYSVRDVSRSGIAIETGRLSPPEQRVEQPLEGLLNLASVPESVQMVCLNFEQAGFHSCSAASRQSRLANRNTSSRSTAD
jgi:hypothetical protein